MELPKRAGDAPIKTELQKDKTYYWCACGLSAKQPFCDGSHKETDLRPMSFTVDQNKAYFVCACKQTKNAPYCDGSHKK